MKFSIGGPYVCCFPVENRICIIYIVCHFRSPTIRMVHLIFTIQINTPPPIEALLRTYTNKATGTYCIFFIMYPFSKTHLKFIVPHLSIIKRKVLLRHCIFRHRTYPQFLFPFFPRTPERLIHRRTGCHTERNTNAIHINNIFISLDHAVHIVNCHFILYFIIHMKYSDTHIQIVTTYVINT